MRIRNRTSILLIVVVWLGVLAMVILNLYSARMIRVTRDAIEEWEQELITLEEKLDAASAQVVAGDLESEELASLQQELPDLRATLGMLKTRYLHTSERTATYKRIRDVTGIGMILLIIAALVTSLCVGKNPSNGGPEKLEGGA